MNMLGIEVCFIYIIDGYYYFNEVYFIDVKVLLDNLVGKEGMGWMIVKFLLMYECIMIVGVVDSYYVLVCMKMVIDEVLYYIDK